MPKKLEKLESLRGFAAIYVVLYHLFASGIILFGVNLTFLFKFGQEAVLLFFILSGFVITYSFEKGADKSFKLFFFKRFFRIFIPLIIIYITNIIIYSFQKNYLIEIDYKNLLLNICMLQDIAANKPGVICDSFLDNLPLWSLSYEWWFYILFFLVFIYKKKNQSLIVYIISIIAAITYLFYPNFVNREIMYLSIWWLGGDIARLYLEKKEINFVNLKLPIYTIFTITLIMFLNIFLQQKLEINNFSGLFSYHPWLEFRHFLTTLIIINVALFWRKLNWFAFNHTIGFFKFFAPISFVLYISHWFLIINATYLNNIISNVVLRYLCYTLVCLLFSYLVEKIIYVHINRILMKKIFN